RSFGGSIAVLETVWTNSRPRRRADVSGDGSALHPCNRRADCTRVARWPAAAVHLRQEIADDPVEFVRFLDVYRVTGVRHDGERCRRNGLLQENAGSEAGPVLV